MGCCCDQGNALCGLAISVSNVAFSFAKREATTEYNQKQSTGILTAA